MNLLKLFFLPLLCLYSTLALADTQPAARLVSLKDMVYEGAFRIPFKKLGESDMTYAEGQIAFNADNKSLFVVGHKHQQAIAEFIPPKLSKSRQIEDLPMASKLLQPFSRVLHRAPIKDPNHPMNTIGGLLYYKGKLIVNAYEYYDGAATNRLTTLVVENANNLKKSRISGFHSMQGAVHAAGWISPIPSDWQERLGGKWLAGNSSSMPIISRLSVGPSAFLLDPESIGQVDPIPTEALLDFSLQHPLHDDLFNETENSLWNHLSRAVYGFILPGSDSYLTFGFSGGHQTGVCYKCTPKGAQQECPGYCAKDKRDRQLRYWFWNVHDLHRVQQGKLAPHQIRPYEFGDLPAPFPAIKLGGGSFDPNSGRLYLTLDSADRKQTKWGAPPIFAVYSFK